MLVLNGKVTVPAPANEPVLSYAPRTPERAQLQSTLAAMAKEVVDIPNVIGGRRVETSERGEVRVPHRHAQVIGRFSVSTPTEAAAAIDAAKAAWHEWSRTPFEARAAIFLKAADLLATKYRPLINASTMLGQSKTCHQAEIDAACELIDFWRYNVHYAQTLYAEQPRSAPGMWNVTELRPLEGFVFAVTPFNFTSIAANLATAPALMGNTVVWKPSNTQLHSAWVSMQLLEEAGLPPGVVNLVTGPGPNVGDVALRHRDLAGVHFTGSTATFQHMWRTIGESITGYRSYPRLVGETGGKDFIVAHPSADRQALVTAIVRGGYEYQGQKCSAASRVYVARSVWKAIEADLVETIKGLRMGDVADFRNFMGAVIDERSFRKIEKYIGLAKSDGKCKVLAGGEHDRSEGWFVRPTLVRTDDPRHTLMQEEIFGPVVTAFVYPDEDFERILALCDETSPYGLTGAIFANDRRAIVRACDALRHAAGNFYINDKPTGAVVGQQPFGGARASGTDDKAGAAMNLLRWVAARTIKETFVPPTHYDYPYMQDE